MDYATAEILIDYRKKEYSRHVGTLDRMIDLNSKAIMEGRDFPRYFLLGVFDTREEASKRLDIICKILDEKFL